MKQAVEVPQVGESVTSGILAVWNVADGDYVNEGDEIFELETDKATLPVPAPASGVISISVAADEEVEIGTVVAEIDTEGAPGAGAAGTAPEGDEAKTERESAGDAAAEAGATAAKVHDALSPAVRRILEEHGLDAATVGAAVAPSGKDGRLTKGDVEKYLAEGGDGGAPGDGDAATGADRSGAIAEQTGTAPGRTAVQSQPPKAPADLQERKKMSNLRKTIAENLVRSKQQSAHLTTFNEVDMSAVMALRSEHKEQFEAVHEVRLGFMSFFVKAAQRALVDFPAVNAFVDGTEVIYNYFYNVGVAISTDAGLLVPVLRDVDTLDFAEIERKIGDFAARARKKRLMPDEFSGGTFTITNGGVFGSMLSTPIPSPPQTAVLGMHSIVKRPVVVNDEIVIRPIMYLALTYDHRIIDGKQAIGFLNRIKAQIEDPAAMLLGL
jgi:2-oxoglutarate dehydrogenase E2 component (dihydrolipoamide succinyltransferase)